MKKLLTLFLITALTLGCLAGCGNSEPAEKENTSEVETQQTEETSTETEVVESEDETEVAETEIEETTDEVEVPEMELATATMQSEDGSAKIEITYNATNYEYLEYSSDNVAFFIKESVDVFSGKYEDVLPVGGSNFWLRANFSAQDCYNEKVEACNNANVDLSEMEQFTIGDKTAYVFSDNYMKDDWKTMTPTVVVEVGNHILMSSFPTYDSDEATHEDFIWWVNDVLVDVKVVE